MLDLKRREFIALVGAGGLLVAVKVKRARGQQPTRVQTSYSASMFAVRAAVLRCRAIRRNIASSSRGLTPSAAITACTIGSETISSRLVSPRWQRRPSNAGQGNAPSNRIRHALPPLVDARRNGMVVKSSTVAV